MNNLQKKVDFTAGVFLTFASDQYAGIKIVDHPSMLPYRYVQVMKAITSFPKSLIKGFKFEFPYNWSMEHTVTWADNGQVFLTPTSFGWHARELEQEDLPALIEEAKKEVEELAAAFSKSPTFKRVEPAPFFTPVELKKGEKCPEWHFKVFSQLNRRTTLYDN